VFKDFSENNNPGEKIFLATDPKTKKAAYIFLRLVPPDVAKQIDSKYPGKKKWVRTPTGSERVVVRTTEEDESRLYEKLCYAWCASENLVVTPSDDGSVAFYKQHVGPEVTLGEDIVVDDHLNDAIKIRMLKSFPEFFQFIVGELDKKRRSLEREEEDDIENL